MRDVAAFGLAVVRPVLELARRTFAFQSALPSSYSSSFTPFSQCSTWLPLADDAGVVPPADRFQVAGGRRIERVRRPRRRQSRLVVGGLVVVEQLVLGRAPVDVVVLLGAAIKDPRVARLADPPLELELEVAELIPA